MHYKVGYWAIILGLHFISSSGFTVDMDEGFPRASSFRDLDRKYRNTDSDRHKESSVLTRRSFERIDKRQSNRFQDLFRKKVDESTERTRNGDRQTCQRTDSKRGDVTRIVHDQRSREPGIERNDRESSRLSTQARNPERYTEDKRISNRQNSRRYIFYTPRRVTEQSVEDRDREITRRVLPERDRTGTQRQRAHGRSYRITNPFTDQGRRALINVASRRVRSNQPELVEKESDRRQTETNNSYGTQIERWNSRDTRKVDYRLKDHRHNVPERNIKDTNTQTGIGARSITENPYKTSLIQFIQMEQTKRSNSFMPITSHDLRKREKIKQANRHKSPRLTEHIERSTFDRIISQPMSSQRQDVEITMLETHNSRISATKERHQNPTSMDKPFKKHETIRSGRVLRERSDRIVRSEVLKRDRELSRARNSPFGRVSVKANVRASEDHQIHQSTRQEREQHSSARFERFTQNKDKNVEHLEASDRAYLLTRSNTFKIIASRRVSMERRGEVRNRQAEAISRISDSLDSWKSATQSLELERNKRKSAVQKRDREFTRRRSNLFQMMRFRQVLSERRNFNQAIDINTSLLNERESATRSPEREREKSSFIDKQASKHKSKSTERRIRTIRSAEIQERHESISSQRVLNQRKDEVANRRAQNIGRVTQNRDHRESANRLLERDTTSFQRKRTTESKNELQNNNHFRDVHMPLDRDSRKVGFTERGLEVERSNLQGKDDRVRSNRQNNKLELTEKTSQSSFIRHKRQTSEVTRIRRKTREEENIRSLYLVHENEKAEDTSTTRLEMRFQEQQRRSISPVRLADDRREVTRSRFLDCQREIISQINDDRSTDHQNRQRRDVKHSRVNKLSLDRLDRGDTMIENVRGSLTRSVHRQDRQRDDILKERSLEDRRQSIDYMIHQRFHKRKTRQPEDVTPTGLNERLTFAVWQERDENNNEERLENSVAKEYRNLPTFGDYQKAYTKMWSNLLATTISLVIMSQIVVVSVEPKRFRLCNLRNTLWPTKQKIL